MPRSARRAGTNEIRSIRLRLQLSQCQFATLLGVSVETYRTWDSGRRLVADEWLERYYRRSYSRFAARPPVPERPSVPSDWNRRLVRIRRELRLTQTRLAERIGAAGKAVVYQWESRKRKPSPVFWRRIEALITG
jgi:DNA-binding transcriptional regulator YiaG